MAVITQLNAERYQWRAARGERQNDLQETQSSYHNINSRKEIFAKAENEGNYEESNPCLEK